MANETNLSVVLTGDGTQLDQVLQKTSEAITKMAENASKAVDDIGPSLLKMAVGFGSVAGAADMAAGKIMECLSAIVNYIPNCIDSTNALAETYKGLNITAGMSVTDFNTWNAAINLSGGKAEDLTTIVSGMAMGISKHSEVLIRNGIATNKAALDHMTLAQYVQAVVEKMNTLGSATEKDLLLKEAFGKGGMAFAAVLVELNKNMKEAQDITAAGGSITQKAIADLEAHNTAQGRLNLALEKQKALIAGLSTPVEDAYHNMKAAAIEYGNECSVVLNEAQRGHIKLKSAVNESTHDVQYDYKAMIADLKEYNKRIEEAVSSSKTFMDVGTNAVKNTTTHVDQKAIDAEKEAQKKKEEEAKRQAREDATALNRLQEELNHLKDYDLHSTAAITLEEKKTRSEAEALQHLEEDKRKIKEEESKSNTKSVHEAANQARLMAQKAYDDRMLGITADYNKAEEDLNKKWEAEKTSGIIANNKNIQAFKIEAVKVANNLGIISDEEALRRTIKVNNDIYQADKEALNQKLQIDGLTVTETRKILNEVQTLEDKHNKDILKENEETYKLLRKKNPMLGLRDGAKDYINAAKDYYTQFKGYVNSVMNAAESSIAGAMKGMIEGQMSLKDAMKSIWKGIAESVLDCLTQMIAKWIVAAAASEVFRVATKTAGDAQASASLDTAVAESFAAYAYIPFVGFGLGAAQAEAIMLAFTASKAESAALTGFATGGYVDKPTPGIFGEKGGEYLVPQNDMKSLIGGIVASSVAVTKAIATSRNQVNGYATSSASYAPTTSSNTGNNNQGGITINCGHIIGESVESGRVIANMVQKAQNNYNKRNG